MTHKLYSSNNFAYMLKKYNYNLNLGDIVAGTIIYKEFTGFLVNIGDDILGYLPKEELGLYNLAQYDKQVLNLLLNTTREFLLITNNPKLKQAILSIKRLDYIRAWKRIQQYPNENIIFNLKLKYKNNGGFITSLDGINGFIPRSQIYLTDNIMKVKDAYIQAKLITINEQKNLIIFSNKSALLCLSKHKFRIGELIYGEIKIIQPYGLFIQVYQMIALLHISEITSIYIDNIYNYFTVGKIIKIKIIHIDMKQGRLSLSRRYSKNNIK